MNAPSFGASLGTTIRMETSRLIRGQRLRVVGIALALIVLSLLVVRYAGSDSDHIKLLHDGIELGFFGLLVFLCPIVFGTGAIADEVENRTFTFLTTRPVSKSALFFGKGLAANLLCVGTLVVGVLVAHLSVLITTPGPLAEAMPWTLRAIGSLALLASAYTWLCLLASALVVEAPAVVATLYLAVIEFAGSMAPSIVRLISLRFHATNLVGFEQGGLMAESVPAVHWAISASVIFAVTLIFALLGALAFRSSEYRPR